MSSLRIEELHDASVNGRGKSCYSSGVKNVSTKIFCDPVHGQMTLHPACVAIIDTPQFQRLRHINQTGFTEYVYPGSSHSRFGHSLGVCYLAGEFLQKLREHQPELLLSDTDVLCVELAGLCHDLGHGPYSHTWESIMNNMKEQKNYHEKWKHELVSANMIDYLIEDNNLYPILKQYGIGTREINQVKEYILGAKPQNKSKAFLHQIVNNDDSGLDVDKWDYFLRDCLHLGLPCSFEYQRLIQCARVFYVDGRTQICFRDKVLECVYNVFRTRSNLHRCAYQHKVVTMIERMFIDAVLMADEKLTGPDGEILRFWEWSMNAAYGTGDKLFHALEKFSMLTDALVYNCLKYSPRPDVQMASKLIKAIDRRSCNNSDFYHHVGLKILKQLCNEDKIHRDMCSFLPDANALMYAKSEIGIDSVLSVSPYDICVRVISVNWGKGSKNPVEYVHFYSKETSVRVPFDQLEMSVIVPKSFEEVQVHVVCRRSDPFAINVTRWCFDMYWKCYDNQNKNLL